jgi:hypothetical protein
MIVVLLRYCWQQICPSYLFGKKVVFLPFNLHERLEEDVWFGLETFSATNKFPWHLCPAKVMDNYQKRKIFPFKMWIFRRKRVSLQSINDDFRFIDFDWKNQSFDEFNQIADFNQVSKFIAEEESSVLTLISINPRDSMANWLGKSWSRMCLVLGLQ